MKNQLSQLSLLFILLLLNSCSSDEGVAPNAPLKFNLTDAKAILYKTSSSEKGVSSNGRIADSHEGSLFKIDSQGKISSVVDSVNITLARAFSEGLYVETGDGKKFYVKFNNTFIEIENEVGDFIGANDTGDLVFSDVSILRANSLTVEKLQTSLDAPFVQSLSENLAIITDGSIYQIYNTVTNVRYNVNGCNGPQMESFDDDKALIDDCQNKALIDMTSGERSEIDINSWNHESLRVNDGIVVLSQGLTQEGNTRDFALGHVNSTGKLLLLTQNVFQPGASSCMNCGNPNAILFGGDNYLVVRELSEISVLNRSTNEIEIILEGLNIIEISFENDIIYYLAEDNLGNPITGIYTISTQENTVLDSEIAFENVATFQN